MLRMNIKTKIILSTFLVVAVSLSVCGFFTYSYVTGILKEQSIRDNTVKLGQTANQLRKMQEQLKKTASYVITDEEVNKLLNVPFDNAIDEYMIKLRVEERLKRFVAIGDYVSDIIILRPDGQVFSNTRSFEDYYRDMLKEPWFTEYMKSGLKTGFSEVHKVFIANAYEEAFSYITRYRSTSDPSSLEYVLLFDLRYQLVDRIFEQGASEMEKLVLINGDKGILYCNQPIESPAEKEIIEKAIASKSGYVEDKKNLAIANLTMLDDWKQVAVIPKDKLYNKVKKIFPYFVIVILVSLLFILFIMIPIIMNITRPLSILAKAMKKLSGGDMNTSINIRSGDELEYIGEGFNRMVGELNQHILESINHEKMKRRMQVDLLMSQINPHFIYNTLNSIIYLTHAGRNEDVAKITEAIIGILQDTVKSGEEAVFASVHEELHIVENYLTIQKFRYPGMFDIQMDVSEDLMHYRIPRMVIQPVVENALFHGICPSEKHGVLRISCKKQEDRLIISVEDNGVGMDDGMMANLFAVPKNARKSNQTRSIGLRNIKERIEFLYGSGYGVQIDSRKEEGTRIDLYLPLEPITPPA